MICILLGYMADFKLGAHNNIECIAQHIVLIPLFGSEEKALEGRKKKAL